MKSLVNGILTGSVAGWGSTQYGQYARILGVYRHIGIEIEAKLCGDENITNKWYGNIAHSDSCMPEQVLRSWPSSISYVDNREGSTSHSIEVSYLFKVEEPKRFFHHTNLLVKEMANHGFTGVGGVHANFQVLRTDVEKGMIYHDLEGMKKVRRAELKYGPSFIQPHQLRMGIFLAALILSNRTGFATEAAVYADKVAASKPNWLTLGTFLSYTVAVMRKCC